MLEPPDQTGVSPKPAAERLDSWKEIAAYLKRGVRAVQRWEKEEGLPVHRHRHKKLGSVYAYKSELDEWLSGRQTLDKADGTIRHARPDGETSIAVLPFVNTSSDKTNEYFSDGITEELITALAKVEELRVASRTSVFQFKGKSKNIRDIGRQLKVRMALEGSVRKAGSRLRIVAQLVDVESGYQLWSETYDRRVKDIFAIQEEISRNIVAQLSRQLLERRQEPVVKKYTEDFEAYNLYLRGRHCWNQRTRETLTRSIEFFQKAVTRDPDYSVAYTGLADSYSLLGFYSYLPPRIAFPKAKAAALKALEKDATLAEAHASLAVSKMFYDWDWKGAEIEFERALELNPDYAIAHYWYSLNLTPLGRPYDALDQIMQAQQLDPASPVINSYVAAGYYFARLYDKAIERCLAVLETEPNFELARLVLGWSYREKQRFAEAITQFERVMRAAKGESAAAMAALGHVYAVSRKKKEARRILEDLKNTAENKYVSPGHIAMIYIGLAEKGRVFAWLRKAQRERYAWLVFLRLDPLYDSLRSDPRYTQLVEQMRFVH